MALIEVVLGGIRVALGIPSSAALEESMLSFANPYLACMTCGRRAVGSVGATVNVLSGKLVPAARNWPCYHASGRISLCDDWTATTGCRHDEEGRLTHGRPRDTDMNQMGVVPLP